MNVETEDPDRLAVERFLSSCDQKRVIRWLVSRCRVEIRGHVNRARAALGLPWTY